MRIRHERDGGSALNGQPFDKLVRNAASTIDRKTSLKLLGAAALGSAMIRPLGAEAKNGRKKKKKGGSSTTQVVTVDPNQQCAHQKGECLAFVQFQCARDVRAAPAREIEATAVIEDCFTQKSPCCEAFATCNATAGLECLGQRAPIEK
jgi:hypothetical protein